MRLHPVSKLRAQAVAWLWPGRLALGKLAMLDGDPGLGKSLLALDLCARLSTGRAMPDGAPSPGICNTLVLNAEDGEQDTIRPRLQALGADLRRVFVLGQQDLHGQRPLRLPSEMAVLDAALARTRARLVVVDPIVAFLDDSVSAGCDQAARRALTPLAQLTAEHAAAALMVRHLNKNMGGRALYRGAGSIGFLGACRSGWLVGRDPDQPERRVLAQVKNNLAPPQPSLAFTIQSAEEVGLQLAWLGTSPLTADDLLAGCPSASPTAPRERARVFLAEFLADGPRTSREIWDAALDQGLSERTLYRVRQELKVRIQRVYGDNLIVNYWLLPGQALSEAQRGDPAVPDLEEWLAPLRERYPPSTPLDDF